MRNRLRGAISVLLIGFCAGLVLTKLSLAQQTRVRPVHQAVVVDSKGKTVGTSLGGATIHASEVGGVATFGGPDNEIRPMVLLEVNGQLVAVNVARDRFYAGAVLFFDSQNCTGNAWLSSTEVSQHRPPLLPRTAIGLPGQTLYVERLGAGPETFTSASRLEDGRNCVNFNSLPFQAVPMQPLVELSTVFTPPFSLRAAP